MDYSKSEMDGNTTVIARAAQIASTKGIFIVNSAGNEDGNSWGTLVSPADAEGVLAVGSITSSNTKSFFSSIGPSADGRIKPDLAALGSSASIIGANGIVSTSSGTSFSSPQVAGLAAGLIQAFPEMTINQIKNLMILSASQASQPDTKT